jgi:sugar lactone lactonase YvrE
MLLRTARTIPRRANLRFGEHYNRAFAGEGPMMRQIIAVALTMVGMSAHAAGPEVFLQGNGMNGIHGIAAGPDGMLYAGSVVGQSIFRIDPKSGEIDVWQGPPLGMADDLVFARDGRLVWTSFMLGKVHARKGDGPVQELATDLPGINSLAFHPDGRLFATQVFLADALHEIDPAGRKPARKVMEGMGGLNGFQFGPDGKLYGPLWFKGEVARVDVDAATVETIASGFGVPAAANFGPDGKLYVLDTLKGEVVRVDTKTGEKARVAAIRTGLDNLDFGSDGTLYVTGMAEAAVFGVNVNTGDVRTIEEAPLVMPTDLDYHDGTLYIADVFSVRAVNPQTKESKAVVRAPLLEYAFGIDVTDRYVHTASWFNSAAQTFNRKTGELVATYHDLPTAYDVLEDSDGSLLVLQMFGGSITRLRANDPTSREPVASGLSSATAMARGADGTVYVTLYGRGEVARVDIATGVVTTVVSGLQKPEGIAATDSGVLLVLEEGGRLLSVEPGSGRISTLAEDLVISLPVLPSLPPMGYTSGVAVSPSGQVFLPSQPDASILLLTKF